MKIKGKKIWITGASSGIGAALTKVLAADNQLLLLARSQEKLEQLSQMHPNQIQFELFDVSDAEAYLKTEGLIEKYFYPDLVFFNAGISQRAIAKEAKPEVFKAMMDVNYFGVINPFLAILHNKPENQQLQVVVTNSVAGKFGYWMRSGYAASKHALTGFFDTVALEEYQHGLRVTQVFPGRIDTPINQHALMADGKPSAGRYEGFTDAMKTEYVVRKIINATAAKKSHKVIAKLEWIPFVVYNLSKGLFFRLFSKRKPE
ncbi:SDR family NAD(P)-dependent oxidoreductase [Luteibaculum oceani]|uniref:SDR family NAD(P)-dependent oxidoreductase n=1 Tax=Luteibaculum oceani TaxID=1294296 RepID=A0A5C6V0B4_9FLAO|nr:SDR family NAD(P)-dependent oxidoreductase [Luteibaculum oceani]TXC78334.1 SDR family NAD(P)-dependent oxidoreductase [Luteibaculum oceani]